MERGFEYTRFRRGRTRSEFLFLVWQARALRDYFVMRMGIGGGKDMPLKRGGNLRGDRRRNASEFSRWFRDPKFPFKANPLNHGWSMITKSASVDLFPNMSDEDHERKREKGDVFSLGQGSLGLNNNASDDTIMGLDCDDDSSIHALLGTDEQQINKVEEACCVAWGIWSARNKVVWERGNMRPEQVIGSMKELLQSWQSAQLLKKCILAVGHNGTPEAGVPLHPRIVGAQWSCKVDAAVFEVEERVGFGFMIRRSNEEFLYAGSGTLRGRFNARVAEALAIREVLLWIRNLFPTPGIIYSDCKEVVTSIGGDVEDVSEFGNIVSECRWLLKKRVNTQAKINGI
ncbi:hypothetical protein ACFE04_023760 [Oxalis oulophora]